jgi:hypothetical protein
MLYDLKLYDPVSFWGVAVVMIVAWVASYVTAFEGSRLDPREALRE